MPRKPIITAVAAASLATSANADLHSIEEMADNDIVASESIADDILIHDASDAELGDLIGGWEPPATLINESDYDFDYLAQTIYAGPGEDGVRNSPSTVTGIKKPGQGITLDNGLKKPGKLRTQGQVGQKLRKQKKLKK